MPQPKAGLSCSGCSLSLFSQIVRGGRNPLDRHHIPSSGNGAIVAIIGLELAPVATDMAGLTGKLIEQLNIPHVTAISVSMFTLAVTILGSILLRLPGGDSSPYRSSRRIFVFSMAMGIVDFASIAAAPGLKCLLYCRHSM